MPLTNAATGSEHGQCTDISCAVDIHPIYDAINDDTVESFHNNAEQSSTAVEFTEKDETLDIETNKEGTHSA
eukprot:4497148-Ditylum_brightwellii.AAC.1